MNLSGQECAFLKSVKKKEIIRNSSKAIELFLYLCPKFANVNLIIDQGNTTTKVALFCQDKLEYVMTVVKPDKRLVDTLLDKYRVTSCIYSSVVDVSFCFLDYLQERISRFCFLDADTPIPVKIEYGTPTTLGRDRIAGVVGAFYEKPDCDILIIDAGTAITYDLLLKRGVFIGGNIAPGIRMRLKALNHFTGKLPLIEKVGDFSLMGTDTETAIRAGVIQGVLFEMEGYIRELKVIYPDLLVFLTGGDAFLLAERLKTPIFVDKNIVLKGLNRILYYNAEK